MSERVVDERLFAEGGGPDPHTRLQVRTVFETGPAPRPVHLPLFVILYTDGTQEGIRTPNDRV